MAERIGHFEIPDIAYHAHPINDLSTLMTDIVILHNEIVSFDKEVAQGETQNYILRIADSGISLQKAVTYADDRLERAFQQWIAERGRISYLYPILNLWHTSCTPPTPGAG
ncbi:hypothetical protein GKO32_21695 [Amycolatopsis sp. RM579]|uniref:Terpene synthase n=1 Tax=Amycolatopsis pithecellobii TaxID=664692 RepID=A0A6N7YU33_9PSEU|nr:hypothetical protein [Amycolatopsis pithecellobii]